MSDWIESAALWFCGIVVVGAVTLMAVLGYSLWAHRNDPTFQLTIADWVCSKEKSTSTLMPMTVGNTTVLVPQTTTRCVRWDHR